MTDKEQNNYIQIHILEFCESRYKLRMKCLPKWDYDQSPCELSIFDKENGNLVEFCLTETEFSDFCDMVRRAHNFSFSEPPF